MKGHKAFVIASTGFPKWLPCLGPECTRTHAAKSRGDRFCPTCKRRRDRDGLGRMAHDGPVRIEQ